MLTNEEIDRFDVEALRIAETNGCDWMRAFADLVTAAEREAWNAGAVAMIGRMFGEDAAERFIGAMRSNAPDQPGRTG